MTALGEQAHDPRSATTSAPVSAGPRERPAFIVDVEGYEGPIDVLLNLARDQKVDLKCVSIVELADQYLAFIADARRASLELAAEYLVMAAWLAFLKSRLLLPEPPGAEEPSGEEMAAALAFQLRRLEAIREAGAQMMARPRLGSEVFARGVPEERPGARVVEVVRVDLFELLRAYGGHLARKRPASLRIVPSDLTSVDEAVNRLRRMLGRTPDWARLSAFLPPGTVEGLDHGRLAARSALAATFAASLELAREGTLRIRQRTPFGPILVCAADKPIDLGATDGEKERP